MAKMAAAECSRSEQARCTPQASSSLQSFERRHKSALAEHPGRGLYGGQRPKISIEGHEFASQHRLQTCEPLARAVPKKGTKGLMRLLGGPVIQHAEALQQ